MIFDKPEHRNFILQVLEQVENRGEAQARFYLEVVEAVKTSTIAPKEQADGA